MSVSNLQNNVNFISRYLQINASDRKTSVIEKVTDTAKSIVMPVVAYRHT